MKPKAIALVLACLSLGLTLALGYVQRQNHALTPVNGAATPAPTNTAPAPAQVRNDASPRKSSTPSFSWKQIESEDYHVYIAHLRAIGCPEQTIRDIIVADVNKLYAARENPLKTAPKPGPNNTPTETVEQKLERLRQLRTVQQEKRWVIKELLGVDLPLDLLPSSGSRDYHAFEVAFKYLPEDKRDAVQSLQETYWQQSDALDGKNGKKRTPESQAEARQLKDWLRQELSKVLTPQELEEYDLRTSTTAKQLSSSLSTYFRPSEEEFRKIYRAKQSYEDTMDRLSAQSLPAPAPTADPVDAQVLAQQRQANRQALAQARTDASNQLNEQLKSALGDDRYNEYQRSQDRNYDLLARCGTRYNLSQEAVQQAYDLQQSYKAQANAPQANMAALQQQFNQQLTTILGEQAARGYQRVHGGTVPLK